MKSELYYQVEYIQNAFIACATQDNYDTSNYENVRNLLINNSLLKKHLPDFVFESRNLQQFWYFIKRKFSTYQERREFIWGSFEKVLSLLEQEVNNPLDDVVSITISENADAYIKEQWDKALERRATDPRRGYNNSTGFSRNSM